MTHGDDLLVELFGTATREAFRDRVAPPIERTATVTSRNDFLSTVTVMIDGDGASTTARTLSHVNVGDRVLVRFATGGAVWVLGVIGGSQGWTSYAVTWTTTINPPVLGNGTLQGFYNRQGTSCDVLIDLRFGSTTNGGTGDYSFSLPFNNAGPVESVLELCKLFSAFESFNYIGWGLIPPNGLVVLPFLPLSAADNRTAQMRNADSSGAPATGRPSIPGHYPLESGGNLVLKGSYRVA